MAKSICLSREIYQNFLNDHLAPLLAEWQFKHVRKEEFCRVDGDTVWRIHWGFSRDGRLDQGYVSIPLGVGFYSVSEFLMGFPRMEPILKPEKRFPCVNAKSFNMLLSDEASDHYWITPTTDPAELLSSFTEDFDEAGWQWFDDFGTLEKCIAWWSHPDNFRTLHEDWYLMAAWWVRGQHQRALDLARQRVDETAAKLARAKSFNSRDFSYTDRAAESQDFYDWLVRQPQ